MNTKRSVHNLKFSEAGVRGVVGEEFTPQLVAALSSAFGEYVGGGVVVLGRDTRSTGAMLEKAVIAGLLAVGCRPLCLGVVPTPTVQMTTLDRGAAGAIVITASHNPAEWNALKFIGRRGTFLDRSEAAELFDLYNQGAAVYRGESALGQVRSFDGAFDRHQNKIFEAIDVAGIREAKLRVAIDVCNGVGAIYSERFLKALGCEVIVLHGIPGAFSRTPEPLPEHLGALSECIREHHCDIGFAQDPDGDRLTLADHTGRILDPQMTLVLAVDHVLGENPGPVTVNVQTSRAVEEIASSYGCETFYAKVGEINVVEKILESNSVIGGEGNCGGVIWPRVHPGRDSYVGMALMLEMLALSGERLSDIADGMNTYVRFDRKLAMAPAAVRELLRRLRMRYGAQVVSTLDGLCMDFDSARVLLRGSNTERALRLSVECVDQSRAEALLAQFNKEIKEFNHR